MHRYSTIRDNLVMYTFCGKLYWTSYEKRLSQRVLVYHFEGIKSLNLMIFVIRESAFILVCTCSSMCDSWFSDSSNHY